MSFPTISQITPTISINRTQVVNLLLASVALEEIGLAHIINTESEKLQAALGTLPGLSVTAPSFAGLISINREVRRTLETVLKNQMLLQFKLEDILDIPPTPPTPPPFVDAGSAWAVGTEFGQGNAQYTTLGSAELEKTVVLGLGNNNIPVGTVEMLRQGNDLLVTYTTDSPYIMNQVHLYVSNVAPVNSNPGGFPYQYTVTDPAEYFDTYTFTVDVSAYAGQTLYIAAHAHILIVQ
ncbi:MAG: hypothetical protein H6Q64_854 [Firmicutes bacterium]|nr:hypothetical protein [Bacillota bacterium]